MSKSLGNFFTIKEILNKFDAEVVRFFLLSTHYRSPIEFSDEQLRESEVSIDRYYTTAARISDFLSQDHSKEKAGPEEKALSELLGKFRDKFGEAMDDDFNTALAIGSIFELIRIVNKYLDGKPLGGRAVELAATTRDLLREAGGVLNIFRRTPEEWTYQSPVANQSTFICYDYEGREPYPNCTWVSRYEGSPFCRRPAI